MGARVPSTRAHVVAGVACLGAIFSFIAAHQPYEVCTLKECSCDNSTGQLACANGHDLNLHGLRRLPKNYTSIVVDSFVVTQVLAGHELSAFVGLQHLSLTRCRVDQVDGDAFRGLIELETLSLGGNHIDAIGAGTFIDVGQLRELNLSFNLLKHIEAGLLDGLALLELLDLSHNKLRGLDFGSLDALRVLRVLDLSYNELQYLQPRMLANLASLQTVRLQGNLLLTVTEELWLGKPLLHSVGLASNPFECNCGLKWLKDRLNDARGNDTAPESAAIAFVDSASILCRADGLPLYRKTDAELRCSAPAISAVSGPLETFQRNSFRIGCNATGDPTPAVAWRLPTGDYLADRQHAEWLHDAVHNFASTKRYYVTATADELTFDLISASGGYYVDVNSLRKFTEGTYTCIAMNPMGNVSADVNVTMIAPISGVYIPSLMFGAGASAAGTLVAGFLGCLIQKACRRREARKFGSRPRTESSCALQPPSGASRAVHDSVEEIGELTALAHHSFVRRGGDTPDHDCDVCSEEEDYSDDGDDDDLEDEDYEEAEGYDVFAIGVMEGSPTRYGGSETPCDGSPSRASGARTKETLGAVRIKLKSRVEQMDGMKERLKINVEKKAERVKVQMEKRAERMRNNMEKQRERMRDKLLTIRDSTTHSLQSIRDTSSIYAHKLHLGVRSAMENVGYTVQSLKELCGAGDLGLTMSVATITTDVDTEESVEVIRNVTLV